MKRKKPQARYQKLKVQRGNVDAGRPLFVVPVDPEIPVEGLRPWSDEFAHLFAAAPDLLEALKECVEDLKCIYGTTWCGQHKKALEAIAKAEGRVKFRR